MYKALEFNEKAVKENSQAKQAKKREDKLNSNSKCWISVKKSSLHKHPKVGPTLLKDMVETVWKDILAETRVSRLISAKSILYDKFGWIGDDQELISILRTLKAEDTKNEQECDAIAKREEQKRIFIVKNVREDRVVKVSNPMGFKCKFR